MLPQKHPSLVLYLQLLLLTTFTTLTYAKDLNCHGSARCFGHHGRENDIISSVQNSMPTWATFADGKEIACVRTGSTGARGKGDWGFCAFFQGIGKTTTYGRDKILGMLDNIKNVGKCNPCGSIPTGWPADNSTGGELTINFVYANVCDGYCSSNAGGQGPPGQSG